MKSFLLSTAVVSAGLIFLVSDVNYDKNWRPYIATNLALSVMDFENRVAPQPEEETCDGSGWITHGDGHKTPCPGCSKCKPKTSFYLGYDYHIYHMGAGWCNPCKKLKKETWDDERVIKYMEENGFKLHLFEVDNPEHKKFFDYYKKYVSVYPTILIFKDGDLRNPISVSKGFANSDKMIENLTKAIK